MSLASCLVLAVAASILFVEANAGGCMKKFDNEATISKVIEECLAKLAISADQLPKFEDYLNDGFDDKCFGKCLMSSLELVAESGSLDRDALIDMIEDQAPKQLINKLTEAVTKCSESTGVLKVESKEDCKAYALFNGCYMTSTDNLC